jgi:DNA-binding NarL/FixJ family response regulator
MDSLLRHRRFYFFELWRQSKTHSRRGPLFSKVAYVLMENIVKPFRILIADDHEIFRQGVKALVRSADWEICGEAGTGREAVTKAADEEELVPDPVILDISMPDLNGSDAARRIRMASKKTEILMLSLHYSDQLIREIVDAGARGYVLKTDSDRDLLLEVTASRERSYWMLRRASKRLCS